MTTERGQVMALRDAAPYELAAGVTMRPLFGDLLLPRQPYSLS